MQQSLALTHNVFRSVLPVSSIGLSREATAARLNATTPPAAPHDPNATHNHTKTNCPRFFQPHLRHTSISVYFSYTFFNASSTDYTNTFMCVIRHATADYKCGGRHSCWGRYPPGDCTAETRTCPSRAPFAATTGDVRSQGE